MSWLKIFSSITLLLFLLASFFVQAKTSKETKYKRCREECLEKNQSCEKRTKHLSKIKRDQKQADCAVSKRECLDRCY